MFTMALILYLFNLETYNYNFFYTLLGKGCPSTLSTIIATGTGFVFGLIFNYIFSILFVFSNTNTSFAKTKKGFITFSALSFIGFLIHTIGMAIGYGLLNLNEWIIKIFLTIIVLFFNYITRKKIIFNKIKEEAR